VHPGGVVRPAERDAQVGRAGQRAEPLGIALAGTEIEPRDGVQAARGSSRSPSSKAIPPTATYGPTIAGPDAMTYGELIARIADAMLVGRPRLGLPFALTPLAAQLAAAVAGEDPALIVPLMEGLEHDLLPRDDDAAGAFGVRLHRFDAAVERALRDWELTEEVAAR